MYPFEEAWFYAEMDSNFWLINHVEGCTELINPNPDQTFGCVYELYSCSRYAHFPTTYYIEEKIGTLPHQKNIASQQRYGGRLLIVG